MVGVGNQLLKCYNLLSIKAELSLIRPIGEWYQVKMLQIWVILEFLLQKIEIIASQEYKCPDQRFFLENQ